jgi:hypothetical protein
MARVPGEQRLVAQDLHAMSTLLNYQFDIIVSHIDIGHTLWY